MENFETLAALASDFARDLIEEAVHPDDVSGAFLSTAVALLITSDGRQATADYLVDLAARVRAEDANGND